MVMCSERELEIEDLRNHSQEMITVFAMCWRAQRTPFPSPSARVFTRSNSVTVVFHLPLASYGKSLANRGLEP
jgi:hypothetical protein